VRVRKVADRASESYQHNVDARNSSIARYRGGHDERRGGATINIDTDQVDAGVVGPQPVPVGSPAT
jgi:hypothetical protein